MSWSTIFTVLALVPFVFSRPVQIEHRPDVDVTAHSQFQRRTAGSGIYSVVSGDTGNAIAAAYSIQFSSLSSANPNVNWNGLQIGQTLNMPSARVPVAYTVVSSDSQSTITQRYNVFAADLSNANPNVNFGSLTAGTKLRVPTYGQYSTYRVASGDYGYAISQAFGITFDALSAANPGVTWTNLQIGQSLVIPAGSSPTTGTLPSPASPSTSGGGTTTTTRTTVITMSTTSTQTTTVYTSSVVSTPGVFVPSSSAARGSRPTASSSGTSSSTSLSKTTTQTTTSTTTVASSTTTVTTKTTTSTYQSTTTTSKTTTSTTIPSRPTAPASSKSTSSTTSSSISTSTGKASPTATVTGANFVPGGNNNDGVSYRADSYTFYQGDGSTSAGWPSKSQWISFSTMWNNLVNVLGQSCQSQFGVANNSPQENQYIYNAIQDISASSGVDHRLILATIVQESSGCVRVKTTISPDGSVTNPGIMQDFNGSGSCNSNGNIQNPCPSSQIYQMITDGVFGTSSDGGKTYVAGLVQDINASGATDAQAIYRASRIYNSGSVPANGDLGAPGSTRCYASDVANRLMGWVGATRTCNLS